jgi:hypothetical protein
MFYGVGDTSEQRDLSGLRVACPLCHQVHERCVFTAGSVYCTRADCQNPHHRQPPAEGVAAIIADVNRDNG